jgi:hypothetical protein
VQYGNRTEYARDERREDKRKKEREVGRREETEKV